MIAWLAISGMGAMYFPPAQGLGIIPYQNGSFRRNSCVSQMFIPYVCRVVVFLCMGMALSSQRV